MGIVCFFQADTKVGFSGESAGEAVIESKQRIVGRSMFSADFQTVCKILIIAFGIQVFDMAVEDAEKRILIQQIFGRIIGVQIRLSVLEQGVQGIQFQEVVQAGPGHIVEFFCQCFLIEVFMEAKMSEQHQTGQNGIYRSFGTVIHPGGTEDFRQMIFFACGKSRTGACKGLGIVW